MRDPLEYLPVSRRQARECLYCGADATDQDHVKPVHAGGLAVSSNLADLCSYCNRVKCCYWPGHGYHPLPGFDNVIEAAAILLVELEYLQEMYGTDYSLLREWVARDQARWEAHYERADQVDRAHMAVTAWTMARRMAG